MRLCVELLGDVRTRVGAPTVEVELPDQANLGDVVAALARHTPGLVGHVIGAEERSLVEPYSFYLDGVGFVKDLNTVVTSESRLVIMHPIVGG